MTHSRVLVLGAALLSLLAASCKSNTVDDSTQKTSVDVGKQCSGKDDAGCGPGGVCVLGVCRLGCSTDAACPQGALCIGDGAPYGCQLATEMACSSSVPCTSGLSCGLDDTCRMACSETKACPRNEQTCIHGTCVSKGELHSEAWFSCTPGARQCQGSTLQACDEVAPGWADLETCDSPEICATAAANAGACSAGICKAGEALCDGLVMKVCNAGHTGFDEQQCATAAFCQSGLPGKTCTPPTCAAGEKFCDAEKMMVCATDRASFEVKELCVSDTLCAKGLAGGVCAPPACTPNEPRCEGGEMTGCDADGASATTVATCGSQAQCEAGLAGLKCPDVVCSVGQKSCAGAVMQVCDANEIGWDTLATCVSEELCAAGLASGSCPPPACAPGEASCGAFDAKLGGFPLKVCKAGQTGWDVTACYSAGACAAGLPQKKCAEPELAWDGVGIPVGANGLSLPAMDDSGAWVVAVTNDIDTSTVALVHGTKGGGTVVEQHALGSTTSAVMPVTDATSVYWLDGATATLFVTNKVTLATAKVPWPAAPSAAPLQDGSSLYARPDGMGETVLRIDKGTWATTTIDTGVTGPQLLAIDAGWLYFSPLATASIYRVQNQANAVPAVVGQASQAFKAAVFGGNFLWVDAFASTKVLSRPGAGGAASTVYTLPGGNITDLLVQGGKLYVVAGGGSPFRLAHLDPSAGTTTPLFGTSVQPFVWQALAAGAFGWHDSKLYWFVY